MHNVHIVVLTSDVDCDGTSYGAHRVAVPAHRALELASSPRDALRHAQSSDQMSSYYDSADDAMTMAAFRATYWASMSPWSREYFNESGYANDHEAARWNPWVYDDTIGIPALDTRYDD